MSEFAKEVIASVEREICTGIQKANQSYFKERSNDQNIKIEKKSEGFIKLCCLKLTLCRFSNILAEAYQHAISRIWCSSLIPITSNLAVDIFSWIFWLGLFKNLFCNVIWIGTH